MSKQEYTPVSAAIGVEQAFKMLEGRWKLVILFQLFGDKLLRFSDLERAIPAISQKMLIQQLRQLESDGTSGGLSIIKFRRRSNMALPNGARRCVRHAMPC